MPSILHRDDSSEALSDSGSSLRPIYIAGIAVAGAIALGVGAWLVVICIRRRAQKKRDHIKNAAFLSVKGLKREDSDATEISNSAIHGLGINGGFSRTQLTQSVVLPEKPQEFLNSRNPQDIIDFHRQSGVFPRAFAPIPIQPPSPTSGMPKPFSFALGSRGSVISTGSPNRASFFSVGSRNSMMSTLSNDSSLSGAGARKVRQTCNPVLPDELLVTVGERLTVVQSFDDGWCCVGRENKGTAWAAPKSLFKSHTPDPSTSFELGVVPAWVFIKPAKGLTAERPMRSSSLGVTIEMDAPGASRDELVSWSNF